MNDDLERLELPEPVAWMCGPQCSTRHSLVRDAFMEIGAEIAPLYTESQVRAILADRQRRHVDSDNTSAGCVKESAESERKRAQAAKPVGYVSRTEFDDRHDPWIAMRKEPSALGSIPVYAAPVEVTEEIVDRAFRAHFPNIKEPLRRESSAYRFMRAALEAALGGGGCRATSST